MSCDLAAAIAVLVEELSPGAVDALAATLRRDPDPATLRGAVANPLYRGAIDDLLEVWDNTDVQPAAVALALESAASRDAAARRQRISVVWTGPSTHAVPVRRTDQALLQVIRGARKRLIVVSFAVYKVPQLAEALVAASQIGVSIAIILESEAASGGKVTYEMAAALGSKVADHTTIYTWPGDLRPQTSSGSKASLHAKCAVADNERLLVSSANLTEYALTVNMELGVLVERGDVPRQVQGHFEALIDAGTLRAL